MSPAGKNKTSVSVQDAIKQTRPFQSPAHEARIGLMLTNEAMRWPLQALLTERSDLTPQQYNVLRILRGAGRDGLPTLEIADRMIERTPGISRMIDRLEAKDLVQRVRSREDRRQVRCHISAAGLSLLRSLDKPIDALDGEVMRGLTKTEVRELTRLLDKLRNSLD